MSLKEYIPPCALFSDAELKLLDEALSLAIEDQQEYFRYGNPEEDGYEPEELAYLKRRPDSWLRLRKLILNEKKARIEERNAMR
jgi:hypothetical protein